MFEDNREIIFKSTKYTCNSLAFLKLKIPQIFFCSVFCSVLLFFWSLHLLNRAKKLSLEIILKFLVGKLVISKLLQKSSILVEKSVGVAGFEPYKSISFGKNWLTSPPFLIISRIIVEEI